MFHCWGLKKDKVASLEAFVAVNDPQTYAEFNEKGSYRRKEILTKIFHFNFKFSIYN